MKRGIDPQSSTRTHNPEGRKRAGQSPQEGRRRISRPHLLLVAALTFVACGPPPEPSKVVNIGAVVDRTGPLSSDRTEPVLNLAFDWLNEGLKAKGFKNMQLAYVLADNQTKPPLAVQRAGEVRKSDDVKAILTDGTQVDIELNKTFYDDDATNDLNVPILAASTNGPTVNNATAKDADPVTQEALHNTKGWNFRTTMSSLPYGGILVRLARASGTDGDVNGDGIFKVATYAIDDAFGKGGAAGVKNALAAQRPDAKIEQILQPSGVDPNSYDYTSDFAALTDANPDAAPDVIIETLSPQYAVTFTKNYLNGAYQVPLIHSSPFAGVKTIEILGDQANGQIGVAALTVDGPSGDEFARDFQDKTGFAPASRDSMQYDGAAVLGLATIIAIQNNNLDDPTQVTGEQVRDALKALSDPDGEPVTSREDPAKVIGLIMDGKKINYVGASGPVDFDELGNVRQRLNEYKVVNKQFEIEKIYDCVLSYPDCPIPQ